MSNCNSARCSRKAHCIIQGARNLISTWTFHIPSRLVRTSRGEQRMSLCMTGQLRLVCSLVTERAAKCSGQQRPAKGLWPLWQLAMLVNMRNNRFYNRWCANAFSVWESAIILHMSTEERNAIFKGHVPRKRPEKGCVLTSVCAPAFLRVCMQDMFPPAKITFLPSICAPIAVKSVEIQLRWETKTTHAAQSPVGSRVINIAFPHLSWLLFPVKPTGACPQNKKAFRKDFCINDALFASKETCFVLYEGPNCSWERRIDMTQSWILDFGCEHV